MFSSSRVDLLLLLENKSRLFALIQTWECPDLSWNSILLLIELFLVLCYIFVTTFVSPRCISFLSRTLPLIAAAVDLSLPLLK